MKQSKFSHAAVLLASAMVLLVLPSCRKAADKVAPKEQAAPSSEADQALMKQAGGIFQPVPAVAGRKDNPVTPEKVALGKMLYYEPRLSESSWISCNSCHNLALYGVDNLPTSLGNQWHHGPRNAPTVLNAAFQIAQFWDGRAADVEEQAKGPMLNPIEMASPHADFAVERIASIPEYHALFKKAFPGQDNPVTFNNITDAIGAFERTLMTESRFDKFLKGDASALTDQEKAGLKTFIDKGCVQCHTGPGVGGAMFQKFGVYKPYAEATGSKKIDYGRYQETKKEADKFYFKVPTLRNIAHTYPYFHDGSVWSLDKAVHVMADVQLNKTLSDQEAAEIGAFLKSLTGKIPADALELPELPPSTDETPKPVT
ncbi:MAG: cytochrome-c peroxidase [Acidobacteriota bacterium]